MRTFSTSWWAKTSTAALILLAMLVTACGGSSNNGNSGSTNTSPIKVGVIGPMSGFESFIGPDILKGVQVAVDQINANGGILGRQVQIVTADTGGDAVDAVPALRKLINVDQVNLIVGPSSLEAEAVLPILQQSKIPDVIVGGTTQLDNLTSKYVWRSSPSDNLLGVAMAYYAHSKGYTKAAVVFGSNESAQTLKAPVVDAFKRHGGTIVADINLVPDQSSYRSEIEQIYAANPQVVFTQVDAQTGATLFSEIKELKGLSLPFIGTDVTASSDFIKAITPATAQKVLTSLQGTSTGTQATDEFKQLYQAKFSATPVELADYGYDGMNILALAADAAGSLNGDAVGAKMKTVANPPGTTVYDYKTAYTALKAGTKINYDGASGPMDFNEHNNVTGGFDAVASDASGNINTALTVTAQQLNGY
ncbi:MAG TPA: ABC transporter substrate-binding protein [Ktedonobacteraceae bacterium]|nr:ABC transporter substrate-binding protein [Ktedonobacteraceae bacterium]